jgi:hypothetical protein
MLSDLATPFYLLMGSALLAALAGLPWLKARRPKISWPRIKLQTERQTCQGTRVTDVALSFSGWGNQATDIGIAQPRFEGTVYIVWKRKD